MSVQYRFPSCPLLPCGLVLDVSLPTFPPTFLLETIIGQVTTCRALKAARNFLDRLLALVAQLVESISTSKAEIWRDNNNVCLWKDIVRATYNCIHILLTSERVKTDSGERQILRNLGSWLGGLTLGRHKPIRQRDFDLKLIIYSAYEQGKLLGVISFVCKVLLPCLLFGHSCAALPGVASLLWLH